MNRNGEWVLILKRWARAQSHYTEIAALRVRSIYFSTRHTAYICIYMYIIVYIYKTNNIRQWCWKMLKAEMVFTYHDIVCQSFATHWPLPRWGTSIFGGTNFSMPQIGPSCSRGAISPGCAKDHFHWCWPGRARWHHVDRFVWRLQRCFFFFWGGGGGWVEGGETFDNIWETYLQTWKGWLHLFFHRYCCLRNMYKCRVIYGMSKYIQIHITYMTVST